MGLIYTGPEVRGLAIRCDGCHKRINSDQERETITDTHEGEEFSKTLCIKCINDIVKKFMEHVKAKESSSELLDTK